jgi:hypothetical protein
MDNSAAENRRDWNQEIYDLYAARQAEAKANWEETRQKRLKHTKPGLPRGAYAGVYRHPAMGDIRIEGSGAGMKLRTKLVDFEMSHWHLDTFLVEYKIWEYFDFASFNIDAEGNITSVNVFGEKFERVNTG